MKRIVIGAGASGGHIFPALAVAEEIKSLEQETEICFIGVGRELEKKLIEEKIMGEGEISTQFILADLKPLYDYWRIVYHLEKIRAS